MASRVIRRTLRKILPPKRGKAIVKVGFPSGSASADNVAKAVYNEFGTRGGASGGGWGGPIPERPFMRNTMRNNRGKYKNALTVSARKILDGTAQVDGVLRLLGNDTVGDIQEEIVSLSSPPNSPVTVAMKGSSNPLVDTGEMVGGVTFKVET
jgi:hypothetical protein